MAHQISEIWVNGNRLAEAMFAKQPAWHGLGTVLDYAPTSEEAIKVAHLDWTVSKRRLTWHLPDGSTGKVKSYFSMNRDDNNMVLGIVGSRYTPHQNSEGFKFLDKLLMDGKIRYEAAFALKGGRQVVLLARMPEVDSITEDDKCLRYICFAMSHDGSMGIFILPTSVRVVCANTLAMALESELKAHVKHTEGKDDRLEKIGEWLSQYNEKFTLFRDHAQVIATRQYTEKQSQDYMATLFPPPKDDASTRVKNNYKELRKSLIASYNDASNQLPSVKGTWWQMYNTVSFHLDHNGNYKASSDAENPEQVRRENRFVDLLKGDASKLKRRAFELACEMAGVKKTTASV